MKYQSLIGMLVLTMIISTTVVAQQKKSYSPPVGKNYPMNIYWGDTHLHSSWSPDANNTGNRRLPPDDAFRFARGEEVIAHNGMRVRLRRPLDFLVVADHAEVLGLMPRLDSEDPLLLKTEIGKRWHEMRRAGDNDKVFLEFINALAGNKDPLKSDEFARSVWQMHTAFAEKNNNPGKFTAFIGYEWTSTTNGDNLHRVVIFKDGADETTQVIPFSSFDSDKPEALWKFLADYEQRTGGEVLAIPHNSNVSAGRMFAVEDSYGKPLTRDYALTRARWEPLVEVTQYKGDSETHPFLSPNDEFADYHTWDKANLLGIVLHKNWMFQYEYARSALKLGLDLEAKLRINPFKFGMIGSTDAHTSFATAEEDNFFGKFTITEPSPDRWKKALLPETLKSAQVQFYEWEMAASGYAAVWATENTREALFEAMQRKETYATTGSRINVRFFGGWDYQETNAYSPSFVDIGYSKGVPMGGDLTKAPAGKTLTFLIRAVKDPIGANLDRVQVIKGWLNKEGKLHEKVYDVAVSDGRTIGSDSRARQQVGSTVDVTNATYMNTIGNPELAVVWTDSEFDAKERAFYYVRVIEIPTPRWTAYDAKFFGSKMDSKVPMTTQERAYTSPIWYTP